MQVTLLAHKCDLSGLRACLRELPPKLYKPYNMHSKADKTESLLIVRSYLLRAKSA